MAVDHNNPQSRDEEILIATIDGTEYNKNPQSRMEELLLELKETIEEGGGGGGGTTNYNDLDNLPQIGGVTLQGNKTASDLGLASEDDLAGKQDTLTFDNAPTANSSNPVKSGGVYSALADKQDALTAGDYVSITNDGTINVTKAIGVYDNVRYVFTPEGGGYNMRVEVYINDVKRFEQQYQNTAVFNHVVIMDLIEFWYGGDGYYWHYMPLIDSREHEKDEDIRWYYTEMDVHEETFDVPQDDSTTLATKGDIDAAISSAYHHAGTKTCVELVAGLLVAANEGNVYNMTDSGTTTADFIEGAGQPIKAGDNVGVAKISDGVYKFDLLSGFVDTSNFVQKSQTAGLLKNDGTVNDEIEGDVSSLKSGLTNLSEEVNGDATTYPYADVITIEDAVPANLAECNVKIEPVQDLHGQSAPYVGGAGKNKLPLTLDGIKAANTDGTWSGNVYTINGGTFTVNTNDGGNVTSIKANGTFNAITSFALTFSLVFTNDTILNGCPSGGSDESYKIRLWDGGSVIVNDLGNGSTLPSNMTITKFDIRMANGYNASNVMFYPMLRDASISDSTFAPYTNICPISGHTEVDVQRDGVNLLSVNSYSGSGTWLFSKTFRVTGNYLYRRANFSTTGGAFTFNVTGIKDGVGTAIDTSAYSANMSSYNDVSNYDYVKVSGYSNNVSNVLSDVMMCFNDNNTDTIAYVPYAGKTYTLALGDTIYGGKVRIDSNGNTVMDVDRAILRKNTSTMNNGSVSYPGWDNAGISQIVGSGINGVISSVVNVSNVIRANTINGSDVLYFSTDDVGGLTQQELIDRAVDVEVVARLATPYTIQLTPQQIQLLKGQNTIYASTGDISVTVNGVSGAIGAVQEQVNDHEERIEALESGGGSDDYTNTEQVVGTWMGEPLYRKSYYNASYSSGDVDFNISNIKAVIKIEGMAQIRFVENDYDSFIPIPYINGNVNADNKFQQAPATQTGKIVMSIGSNYVPLLPVKLYMTMYYTKTT